MSQLLTVLVLAALAYPLWGGSTLVWDMFRLLWNNGVWTFILLGCVFWIWTVGGAAVRQDQGSERCRRPPL